MKRQINNIESSNSSSKYTFCKMMGVSNTISNKQLNYNVRF